MRCAVNSTRTGGMLPALASHCRIGTNWLAFKPFCLFSLQGITDFLRFCFFDDFKIPVMHGVQCTLAVWTRQSLPAAIFLNYILLYSQVSQCAHRVNNTGEILM